MICSIERALPQNWWEKFVEHDVSHILSTEEEFLNFCGEIETKEVINRPNKNPKSNTGHSSKNLGQRSFTHH